MKSISTATIIANVNIALTKAEIFGWKSGKETCNWVAEKATKAAGYCELRETRARAKAEAIEKKLAQKESVTASDVFSAVEEAYSNEPEPEDDTLDVEAHLDDGEYAEYDDEDDPSDFEILVVQYQKLQESHQQFLAGKRGEGESNLLMVQIVGFVNLVPSCISNLSAEEMREVTEMVRGAEAMMADLK